MPALRPVLIVTAHYPPSPESGSRRPYELVGAMTEAGIPVEVLAIGEFDEGTSKTDRGNPIHWVRRAEPRTQDVVTAGENNSREPARKRLLRSAGALLPGVRRQYVTWKEFQGDSRNCQRRLSARGMECNPSLVYSTAPPMATHRAARLIARHHGVPWMAEFRDHWADPATGRNAFADTIFAPLAALIRRQTIQEPDLVIAVSEGIARWLRQHGARDTLVARNGIPDRFLEPFDTPEVHPGRIAYFGEFYLSRTPEPLFRALATLAGMDLHDVTPQLEFAGEVERVGNQSTASLLTDYGLADCATMRGRLPHAEVMAEMRGAGVLLLLAQQQPDQIPNKLYEYIAAKRPILAWVDEEGESAKILRSVGGHFLVTEHSSEAAIVTTVQRALEASKAGWTPESSQQVDDLRTSRQLKLVLNKISETLEGRRK